VTGKSQWHTARKLPAGIRRFSPVAPTHYRVLVKPKDAARYWEIKPSVEGKKVVAFKPVAA